MKYGSTQIPKVKPKTRFFMYICMDKPNVQIHILTICDLRNTMATSVEHLPGMLNVRSHFPAMPFQNGQNNGTNCFLA